MIVAGLPVRYFQPMMPHAGPGSTPPHRIGFWGAFALIALVVSACSVPADVLADARDPDRPRPSSLQVSLNGTTATTAEVQADGAWRVETDDGGLGWLRVEPMEGSGDATLTIFADRQGIDPQAYEGEIHVQGPEVDAGLGVIMRFPQVSGAIVDQSPSLTSSSLKANPDTQPRLGVAGIDRVPHELLVELDTAALAAAVQDPGPIHEPETWDANVADDIASTLALDYGLHVKRAPTAWPP